MAVCLLTIVVGYVSSKNKILSSRWVNFLGWILLTFYGFVLVSALCAFLGLIE